MTGMDRGAGGPKFSVIMPNLQRADRIRVAVESVLAQSFQDWDLHVVDSGSTDGSLEILESISDRRLKVWKIPSGATIAASRNFGIGRSPGEWIALLDSDDEWMPNKLEEISKVLEPGRVLYHRLEIRQPGSGPLGEIGSGIEDRSELEHLLLHGNVIPNSSVVFERSAWVGLGGLDESVALKGVEDFEFLIRLLRDGWKTRFLDRILGTYWRDGRGITRRLATMKVHPLREVYRIHLEVLPPTRRDEAIRHMDRSISLAAIDALRDLGRYDGTFGDLARSLPNFIAVLRWKDIPRGIRAICETVARILVQRLS